jgi:hypothetical protein
MALQVSFLPQGMRRQYHGAIVCNQKARYITLQRG